jgi:hypothetical protein
MIKRKTSMIRSMRLPPRLGMDRRAVRFTVMPSLSSS